MSRTQNIYARGPGGKFSAMPNPTTFRDMNEDPEDSKSLGASSEEQIDMPVCIHREPLAF